MRKFDRDLAVKFQESAAGNWEIAQEYRDFDGYSRTLNFRIRSRWAAEDYAEARKLMSITDADQDYA